MTLNFYPDLRQLHSKLQAIYAASADFQPLSLKPPILDSSIEPFNNNSSDDSPWVHQEQIPGLKQLREYIRLDLEVLGKFLEDPSSASLPPLSTNAPYLIAVWNELVCAKAPVLSVFKTFDGGLPPQKAGSGQRNERKAPGVKVDIVAENGRRWIRVNTIKNSRILAEFREIDSYLTDDESDTEYEGMPPSLSQVDFENSLIRNARSLLQAATANPIEGTSSHIPKITLRLTRLDPTPILRIRETIHVIRDMGIDIQLGERSDMELAKNDTSLRSPSHQTSLPCRPTRRITLDLSALIALVSDLTHFPLPSTTEEAHTRFIPPQEYRTWKETQSRITNKKPQDKIPKVFPERTIEDLPKVYIKQARALTRQLLQEMVKGLIQEIHDQLSSIVTNDDFSNVEFWATPEARSRCLLIVNKIGGANEKRRVHALLDHKDDLEGGIQSYWKGSRYPVQYIPILPINIFPTTTYSNHPDPISVLGQTAYTQFRPSRFGRVLKKTCEYILAHEIVVPDPRSRLHTKSPSIELPHHHHHDNTKEIQRAPVTKVNPKLTAHTVQSMLWGAELGWTTLTGNRSSVKTILRDIKSARVSGRLAESDLDVVTYGNNEDGDQCAALWVVDPRSLAEGMSSSG
ncbi:hypothetical protein AGABI1DRAFT_121501 [Agaricus bisporus var. burnettii JB137-S8]|uniref:DUF1308 domain-containing protein n=1 Tax=Agaricus bisporus var. burnettii (strain JB137-S8 / ATCC MYA-4627 / FGSC 10392) TaxID=597362 RepID=K5X5D8_AGABU|nr:uncharacterized protein AGABI1DRAFT_121501 [Agaricus bisporus var. burnettii JB137-S8]EKM78408.1 hypothetical protein AGABI1DRAFT_121501 [Agaricus bisporus var. burnettii JB137-S8]